MTDAEREEARRIIAVQASTLPQPDEHGIINIGPVGAWERAAHVRVGMSPWSAHVEDVELSAATSGMGSRMPRPRGARFIGRTP